MNRLSLSNGVVALLRAAAARRAAWFALLALYRQARTVPALGARAWSGSPTSPPTSRGRAFGKRKLAPPISPGKSWAGASARLIGGADRGGSASGSVGPTGALFSNMLFARALVIGIRGAAGAGRGERRRRPVRIACLSAAPAPRTAAAAARPRRRARPHRRAAAGAAGRGADAMASLCSKRRHDPRRDRLGRRQHARRRRAPSRRFEVSR